MRRCAGVVLIMELELIYKQANQLGWKMECIKHCNSDKIKYFEFKNDTGSMRVFEHRTQLLNVDTLISTTDIFLIGITQFFISKHNVELEQ